MSRKPLSRVHSLADQAYICWPSLRPSSSRRLIIESAPSGKRNKFERREKLVLARLVAPRSRSAYLQAQSAGNQTSRKRANQLQSVCYLNLADLDSFLSSIHRSMKGHTVERLSLPGGHISRLASLDSGRSNQKHRNQLICFRDLTQTYNTSTDRCLGHQSCRSPDCGNLNGSSCDYSLGPDAN